MSATFSFDQPSLRRRPGLVAGIGVSLALHLVLLFGYRLSHPPGREAPHRNARTVSLLTMGARCQTQLPGCRQGGSER